MTCQENTIISEETCSDCGETWAACCCPRPAVDSCPGECGVVTVNGLAVCSESQLNANKCTIVVESEVAPEMECKYTPDSILKEAYAIVNTSTICNQIPEEYLDFFNSAIRYINTFKEPLWKQSQAVVKTCGRCKFYTPPQFTKIIAVTNELQNCNFNCVKKKYTYVNSEQFTAAIATGVYTIRENEIIIKDPSACGCNEVIPDFLMIDYYKKLRQAETLTECLVIDDDVVNVLIDWIVGFRLGVKFSNSVAQNTALKGLEMFEDKYTSYDSRKASTPHYRLIKPAIRLRK